eukprot:769613-Pleurochrysis_carterae.AAC.1
MDPRRRLGPRKKDDAQRCVARYAGRLGATGGDWERLGATWSDWERPGATGSDWERLGATGGERLYKCYYCSK